MSTQEGGPYARTFTAFRASNSLREDAARDIGCIAGGSWLAPMVSMVRGALRSPTFRDTRIQLFYGGREPRDMLHAGSRPDLCTLDQRFSFVPVMSVGETDEAQSHGKVNAALCMHA